MPNATLRTDDPARNIIVFTQAATGQTVSILVEPTGGATWVSAIVRSTPVPG